MEQFSPERRQLRTDACVYLLYNSSWKFHHFANWAAPIRASGMIQKRQAVRPVYQTCWVTLLQPARRAAVLGQPSSLRPHWFSLKHWPGTETFACSCTPTHSRIAAQWIRSGFDLFYKKVCEIFENFSSKWLSSFIITYLHTVYH